MLMLAFLWFLPCLGSASPAFGKNINHGKTYFVAVTGNDNGPGTAGQPWATINHAAELAKAGDTVIVRGGHYDLTAQIRPRNSGGPGVWITFIGYPTEHAVLDAQAVPRASFSPGILNNGIFQIEGIEYIRVANLTIINSHDAGLTVRDSSNIDLINNTTKGTFSSGIAVWDTNHNDDGTKNIRIIGNTITRATTWDLAPPNVVKRGEPPHEALSVGGAVDFEVAYNHVYDSDKEGIDIKETSKRGKVHHNLVHNIPRQGIYIDAWFGEIRDIKIYSNVIHNCGGAGLVISVENGKLVQRVQIHNNLVFNNDGSGLFFSRWGVDGPRRDIQITNNVFYHNGYGKPEEGQTYYWLTGGLYLFSANVRDVSIERNIFSNNRGFQIGYSELFMRYARSWREVARDQNIKIDKNLIDGRNTVDSPIRSGGRPINRVNIYAVNGVKAIFGNPLFKDPANQDFSLRRGSPAAVDNVVIGAYAPGSRTQPWWKRNFPPKRTHIQHPNIAMPHPNLNFRK
jgi:hypothetical protein